MEWSCDKSESCVEIINLKAEVKMLRARATEDRAHAQRRLEMEIHLATSKDVEELEAQIAAFRAELAEDDKVIDKLIVVMRKRSAEEDSLREDMP